jgi:hypothetical protein
MTCGPDAGLPRKSHYVSDETSDEKDEGGVEDVNPPHGRKTWWMSGSACWRWEELSFQCAVGTCGKCPLGKYAHIHRSTTPQDDVAFPRSSAHQGDAMIHTYLLHEPVCCDIYVRCSLKRGRVVRSYKRLPKGTPQCILVLLAAIRQAVHQSSKAILLGVSLRIVWSESDTLPDGLCWWKHSFLTQPSSTLVYRNWAIPYSALFLLLGPALLQAELSTFLDF